MAGKTKIWETGSAEETRSLAGIILDGCKNHKIFAFYGDLGAGKTTLIQGFCRALGSDDFGKSPTFSIVNEYEYPEGSIFHFDFYRIEEAWEALDMGFEEYLDSGEYVFIEWPERVEALLPEEIVKLSLQASSPENRTITLSFD